jgi:uncharacterized protein (DUF488 family)
LHETSPANNTIWTIGHSTRELKDFIGLLQSFHIELLADVRLYPGSKRYPHFNKESLETSVPGNNIRYIHYKDLGGRRKPFAGSVNNGWRNEAFRGYADYMETETFRNAVNGLAEKARSLRTAFMCSEAVWWSCHRSIISDWLKFNGWTVMHIMGEHKATEHPYTAPARIIGGKLTYRNPELF